MGVVKGGTLIEDSRYVTVSIPKAIAEKIDCLIDVLGYWTSRSAFVREACLEKISGEERRLMDLRTSGVGLVDLYNQKTTDETMYGYSTEGETTKRDLYTGDIAGIQFLYGE